MEDWDRSGPDPGERASVGQPAGDEAAASGPSAGFVHVRGFDPVGRIGRVDGFGHVPGYVVPVDPGSSTTAARLSARSA